MVITWSYELMCMGFSEEIIAGINKYKDVKNILECPPKLLQDPGALWYE